MAVLQHQSHELAKLKAQLEGLSFPELRRIAVENYGVKITRDHTKDDIITTILGLSAKANYAQIADGELKPGWARIKLNNTGDYRSNFPVHVNANGYECQIPFGVEVDVPIRVLESLRNAVEWKVDKNEFGEKITKLADSYPFNVIGVVEGPDPRPGLEVQREARLSPKRRFREKFHFWPTDKVLRDAIQSGQFRLEEKDLKVG